MILILTVTVMRTILTLTTIKIIIITINIIKNWKIEMKDIVIQFIKTGPYGRRGKK